MTDIRNYLKTLPIILLMLVVAWFVSLQLTKQRIAIENGNKSSNVEQQYSPYIWDFKSFNSDIIKSFHKYWAVIDNTTNIKSSKKNPQLSLNFSGELINTFHHSTLVIISPGQLTGQLKIQANVNLQDDVFYYLSNIKLSGKTQVIDLSQPWKAISKSRKNMPDFLWDKSSNKISSLVLQFEGSNNIQIDSVSMPYIKKNFVQSTFTIGCDFSFVGSEVPKDENIKTFQLSETCWLPSTYMWLNDHVRKIYPGSVLVLEGVNPWQKSKIHKINQLYTNEWLINLILYGFVGLFILIIAVITKKYKVNGRQENEEKWHTLATKQLLFKGAIKAIKPYHLIFNYSVVLIPTAIIVTVMLFIKVPSMDVLKMLPVYFLWALFQQFILGYVLAQRIFYRQTQNRLLASLLAASVFSLLHIPSVNLMIMTFVAGGFWAYAWLVFKRFIPLALSHSMLAIVYYAVVSDRFLYSAKTFQWFWQ